MKAPSDSSRISLCHPHRVYVPYWPFSGNQEIGSLPTCSTGRIFLSVYRRWVNQRSIFTQLKVTRIPVRIKDSEFPIRGNSWVISPVYHFSKRSEFWSCLKPILATLLFREMDNSVLIFWETLIYKLANND